MQMKLQEVAVGAARARVWTGGDGEALLLLHGAWGGAELHWAPVWEALAARFRVIAPELPGVGDAAVPGLPSFEAYAGWAAALLDALGVARAWCVGNSFGAAVAWRLAARLGPRCRGVVLVNGVPPPRVPRPLGALVGAAPIRRIFRALFRRINFSPGTLARAFADPARAPAGLGRVLAAPTTARLDLLLRVLAAGAPSEPRPSAPVLLAWGAADRLPGTAGARAARRLQRALPGARLALLPSAGHCPQLERPLDFVAAIASFTDGRC